MSNLPVALPGCSTSLERHRPRERNCGRGWRSSSPTQRGLKREKTINQSVNQASDQSTNESINQINQSFDQSINPPISCSIYHLQQIEFSSPRWIKELIIPNNYEGDGRR